MNVSAISYQPYVYNTNSVSSASMNKISGLSDDALTGKVSYDGNKGVNENPLAKGQSAHFADIMIQQMSLSQANATRVMQTSTEQIQNIEQTEIENTDELLDIEEITPQPEGPSLFQQMSASNAYMVNMIA